MPKKKNPHHRRSTERAQVEQMLGRKLLRGEIPVVPPSQLPRCPIVPTHVKDYENLCAQYERGEISEADLQAKVSESIKALRKPEPPEHPKDVQTD